MYKSYSYNANINHISIVYRTIIFYSNIISDISSISIDSNSIISICNNHIVIKSRRRNKQFFGTTVSLLNNFFYGVIYGYITIFTIYGIGYFVNIIDKQQKKTLVVSTGYSHNTTIDIPNDIVILKCEEMFVIQSINKQSLGDFCSLINRVNKQNRYKKKGIIFENKMYRLKTYKK